MWLDIFSEVGEYEPSEEVEEVEVSIIEDLSLSSVDSDEQEGAVPDALLHDPLFPPGRILYLNRVSPSDAQSSEVSCMCI